VAGFLLLLVYTIYKLAPIAVEAFSHNLLWHHWAVLVINTGLLAYYEGYRGFQKGLSPRVVARAKHLKKHPRLLHVLLAPLYCMGYFHSTKKRKIVVYSLTIGIIILVLTGRAMSRVLLVRLLDQPWRGIVDAGVVVGLSWGLISVLAFSLLASTSDNFDYSPELPER